MQQGLLKLAGSINGIALDQFCIANLFVEIFLQRASGLLTLQQEKLVRKLLFHQGDLVLANSNLRSETLGPILQRLGKITEAEATAIQNAHTNKVTDPIAQLTGLGKFTSHDATLLIELSLRERLKLCCALTSGNAQWAAAPQGGSGIPSKQPLRAIFDGITQFYTTERIRKLHSELQEASHIRYFEETADKFQNCGLIPEEKGMITVASGCNTVGEVFKQSFLQPQEIWQNLLKIALLGIVTLESPEANEERTISERLSAEEKNLKGRFEEMLQADGARSSYFQIFGFSDQVTRSEIKKFSETFSGQFSKERLASFYPVSKHETIFSAQAKLIGYLGILADDSKRSEYQTFLAQGGQGRFEEQSKTLALETAVQQGSALFAEKRFAEAFNVFNTALTSNQKQPRLLTWTGICLYYAADKTGKPVEARAKAKAFLTAATRLDPHCWEAFFRLGEIYQAEGASTESIDSYRKVLLIKPDHAETTARLVTLDPESKTRIEVESLFVNLERIDYYTLLGVPKTANKGAIQKAYHLRTRSYHPDRFFTQNDPEIKHKAKEIYKRTVEAYMVLRNQAKRQEYDQQLASADDRPLNANKSGADVPTDSVRLKNAGDVVQRKERQKEEVTSALGKKFYNLTLAALNGNNYNSAIMNLRLALNAEPNNEFLQKKLAELQAKARE